MIVDVDFEANLARTEKTCAKCTTDTGTHYILFPANILANFEIVSFLTDGSMKIQLHGFRGIKKIIAMMNGNNIPFEEYDNARHRAKMLMLTEPPF